MLLPVLVALAVPAQTDTLAPSPSHQCPALFGETDLAEERRATREERLGDVSRSENLLDIVHSDAGWRAPKPTRVPGVELLAIEEAAEGGRVARMRVGEAWSESCAPGEYLVSVDDGLGSDGLVLALLDEGMLAEHKGELIFVPRVGATPPPFRMIWRSGFALNIAPGANPGVGGSSSSAASKRKAPRTTAGRDASKAQRARADAKAAAENRRTTARPTRPRG